ncbi:hypothetical protein [Candidatus Blastococcus massiliensis]|uniref:hypothetical protein n=1 Tax=Candidatus Blastococcus massiliensis TaxID=1470358 RepID=UPI0012DDAD43|nr:hypothetical protein [Candidatus Blastococcus massiliensis]
MSIEMRAEEVRALGRSLHGRADTADGIRSAPRSGCSWIVSPCSPPRWRAS